MTMARGDFFLLLNSDARLIDDTPLRHYLRRALGQSKDAALSLTGTKG